MWTPEPSWRPLKGGGGAHTRGVWAGEYGGRPAIVKRLGAPDPMSDPVSCQPQQVSYWRREAEVLLDQVFVSQAGLRSPQAYAIDEDADGITIYSPPIESVDHSASQLALALGTFASQELPDRPYWARDPLGDRLARIEPSGGWRLVERTTAADIARHLWETRARHLRRLQELPQVPTHADPTLTNLLGADESAVIAVDWDSVGLGPAGFDVGYLALSLRADFAELVSDYARAARQDRDHVAYAAQVTAVYTAFTRAEWALNRVADGEGALAGKFAHPAVAPYLRTLHRLSPQVEALLAS